MEIIRSSLALHTPPFKASRTDTDRSATYDFLLVFRSRPNYGFISCRYRDKESPTRSAGAKALAHYYYSASCTGWAGQTANLIRAGCADVQSPHHFDTSHLATKCGLHARRRQRAVPDIFHHATAFAECVFRCSAPATWNSSLPRTVTVSGTIGKC